MSAGAYRSPPQTAEPEVRVVDREAALGKVRSTHGRPQVWKPVTLGFLPIVLVLAVQVGSGSALVPVLAISLATIGIVGAFFVWLARRTLPERVDVHEGGLVVALRASRTVILFDDVDEVWMTFDTKETPHGRMAMIERIRFVCHDRAEHVVGVRLERGIEICQAVIRQCSNRLRSDAVRAMRSGETLTFGEVSLDRAGIGTEAWHSTWEELSLVRYTPVQLAFFRGQTIIPWKAIDLSDVPHPTLFLQLVTAAAKKVEVDDPFAALGAGV